MAEVVLDIESMTFGIDQESFCWTFDGTLVDIASWALCVAGNTVTVNLGDNQYICQIDSRNMSQSFNQNTYTFSGRSLTSIFGEGATPIHNTWEATTVHDIINELITPQELVPVPVDIQIPNWNLSAGLFVADGETPIALVKRLATAVGAILYTRGDGTLVIAPKHKQAPSLYDINNVDHSVSDLDDIFSLNESREVKPGYNQVEVTDEPESDGSMVSIEQVSLDSINLIAELRIIVFPFVPSIELLTSHDNITIVTNPVPIEEELSEVIEVIDGIGSVSKPILSITTSEWQDADLGTLVANGTELTSIVEGISLLAITYTTQYHESTVTAQDAEQVQVYMED